MTTLSRRQFMKLCGIAVVAGRFDFAPALPPAAPATLETAHGRVLDPVTLFDRPGGQPLRTLLPDTVVSLVGADGRWYRLRDGVANRDAIQPMLPFAPELTPPTLPRWAEVAAPIAVIRRWCAAEAPLAARVGHGGILRAVHHLPDGRGGVDWLALEDADGQHLGWSQRPLWRLLDEPPAAPGGREVHIDCTGQSLTVRDGERPLLHTPISTASLRPGVYTVVSRHMGGLSWQTDDSPAPYHGLPWHLTLDNGATLAGVYWHNRFGAPVSGPGIQLSTPAARWLYGWLGAGRVIVT